VKDYDAAGGGGPATWGTRFDVSRWGLLVARCHGRRVAGAVVAWRTRGLEMLEGRDDIAVLWDLRVDPAHRREGVGAALFDRAAAWARERGCVRLDVETQDLNVPACRLYASRGCVLRRVDPHAYSALPDETMLLWSLALDERGPPGARSIAPPDGPGGTGSRLD
jgi:ribosomal protein S18 acetylase RimI-like enzyme